MVEIWDAYDKNFCKIENVRLVRGEVIPEGIYHLVCEITLMEPICLCKETLKNI